MFNREKYLIDTISVKLTAIDGRASQAQLNVQKMTPAQAKKSALIVCCKILGLVIPALFIPILHFILVPSLLIGAPVAYFILSKRLGKVLSGEGLCPVCNKKTTFEKRSLKFPYEESCGQCREPLTITEI